MIIDNNAFYNQLSKHTKSTRDLTTHKLLSDSNYIELLKHKIKKKTIHMPKVKTTPSLN
jgi:hypothetical protein